MNIEILRTFCLSLPAVTEDIKWDDDLCFLVGGKMFCVAWMGLPLKVSFKVDEDLFDELSSSDGFIPAPYMARNKWVQLQKVEYLRDQELLDYIYASYELKKATLTKKMKKELDL